MRLIEEGKHVKQQNLCETMRVKMFEGERIAVSCHAVGVKVELLLLVYVSAPATKGEC